MKAIWILILLCLCSCGRGYSEGSRTGVLYKLSHKGIVWKSWEGELNLGGLRSTEQGAVANIWKFSVVDPAVAESANKLEGKNVRVQYVQWMVNPLSQDTDYEATSVTVSGP